jgi:hypothetical protein
MGIEKGFEPQVYELISEPDNVEKSVITLLLSSKGKRKNNIR